jgi:aryl-alcohol dehydrogenase-like predicted oxidoreductase
VEYTVLGASGQEVSRLVHGCEPLGGTDWGRLDRDAVRAAVARALDCGVTTFDTADVYGLGESERALADVLGAGLRDLVVITKVGVNWRPMPNGRASTFADLTPAHIRQGLDESLKRLRLECIPLYFMHRPDPVTPLADTLDALDRCRTAGKIRDVGASNFPPAMIEEANALLPLAAVQLQYNLIDRGVEDALLPTCRRLGIPVMAYGALAQGLLTGKYGAGARFDESDRRHRLPHFAEGARSHNLEIVTRVRAVGDAVGRTPSQVSIRWLLDQPGVACAIAGAKAPQQTEENAAATGWNLSPHHLATLNAAGPAGARTPAVEVIA